MLAAGCEARGSNDPPSLRERQMTELVIKLAKMDISTVDKVGVVLRGDWKLMPASHGRVDGWISYEAKFLAEPSWLESAIHDAYVERTSLDDQRLFSSRVELHASLRDKICFSGKSFMRPKYQHKQVGNWISFDPQPTDSGRTRLDLFIAGRDVSFYYPASNSGCVQEVTFSGMRTPEGGIR